MEIDFKTAKASGYDNAAKKTTAGTYYLVSSEVDLTGVENAYVTLDYILRYNKGDENQQLLITDAFNAEKPAEGWTVLNQKWTEGSDWKTFANEKIAVPAAFLGKRSTLPSATTPTTRAVPLGKSRISKCSAAW